jgi:hypothetical protein
MTDTDFDLSRRSFLDRVLMAAAGTGMTAPAPRRRRRTESGSA